MNEGRVAIYLRDVMKKVRTTHRSELILWRRWSLGSGATATGPGPMACPQTSGHIGAALQ